MKKPFKVMSGISMAALFTVSSIVPVAASENPQEAVVLENFVLEKDGNYYSINPNQYTDFKTLGVDFAPLVLAQSNEGKLAKINDYSDYKTLTSTVDEAFKELEKANLTFEVEKIGKVVVDESTGNVEYILDEQPEDRLNETFFYNVA